MDTSSMAFDSNVVNNAMNNVMNNSGGIPLASKLDIIITIVLLVLTILALIVGFIINSRKKENEVDILIRTFDELLEVLKDRVAELLRVEYKVGLSEEELEKYYKKVARISNALKKASLGFEEEKIVILRVIVDIINQLLNEGKLNEEVIDNILGFPEPQGNILFEVIMYKYRKLYGKDTFKQWVKEYRLDEVRPGPWGHYYYITEEDLKNTYYDSSKDMSFNLDEKIDLLAILLYQRYRGFGILDTLREMNINGFNCGTSGHIIMNRKPKANRSVWVYFEGKYMHLQFLEFPSEEELKRVIQLMIRYGNPGPLTEKRGYIVNTMPDKSRIVAFRPPASEYWAVFVRKFALSDVSPEALLNKPGMKNTHLIINLIKFLIKGQITCAFTGRQGSGKTTLMSSVIRYIDPRYTIRVLEMAPELYLRELYPERNILSVQETATVTAEELQDTLKKSDAAVSIVGEVATDEVALRMIQMGLVASLFTIFSHHANTAEGLVLALRNSLVNAGGYNQQAAERLVTEVVKMDIHLDYTVEGLRYIQRVSEIIPLDEDIPYPEYDENDREKSMDKITQEFYKRVTDRVSFETHDILRFDLRTKTYYPVDRFSKELEDKIRNNLNDLDRVEFDLFMLQNWGFRPEEVKGLTQDEIEKFKKQKIAELIEQKKRLELEIEAGEVA